MFEAGFTCILSKSLMNTRTKCNTTIDTICVNSGIVILLRKP